MNTQEEVLLFVKAGDDGKRYGGCPFCQRVFMILLIKSSRDQLQFKVATVNFAKPPEVFKKLTLRRVPALVHSDTAIDNVDEIIQYLDDTFPTNSLTYDDVDADKSCLDVFQKFCYYVKDVSKDSTQLETELSKIDDLLRSKTTRFICADHITHLDCELIPKLHQIRIAAKHFKKFDISPKLVNLWAYLNRAYNDDVFKQACPSDQEIILHWAEKPETPNLTMEEKARISREEPRFSFDIPANSRK
ncbi:chloride intracellular channel exl-1-like [Parasteatoda tepidariorum]|uniref:chloride intracellular channel exl-1-like n=1 Tax=Parasteatoda tepidariorum TaxID=114398 RepID=UPI00077F9001|nr:chloride intracellular channel exl-1-like [Parasteatoda tepidariorum]